MVNATFLVDFSVIELTDKFVGSEILSVLEELYFENIEGKWTHFSIRGVHSLTNINHYLHQISNLYPEYKEWLDKMCKKMEQVDTNTLYELERSFSPIKIRELDIPCYIISIKPRWAAELFEYRILEEKLALNNTNELLVLNTQNVYYRAAKPNLLEFPARILWYITTDKSNKYISGKQSISAASYIDEIFIDSPKKLFKQFQKLGIYQWKDIAAVSGNIETNIMAFSFSNTELLKTKIELKQLKKIYAALGEKKFMPLSPIRIETSLYLQLYEKANK